MVLRLSFTTMATPGLGHRGAIGLARRFGFDGVDVRCSDHLGEVTPETPAGELEAVGRDFREAGLAIPSVLCYEKPPHERPDGWAGLRRELGKLLAVGERLGAESIRIFGGNASAGGCVADYTARLAETIRAAIESDSSRVAVVLQNHNHYFNARQAAELAAAVGHTRFGLAFSVDHCVHMGEEGLGEILRRVAPHTRELYLGDVNAGRGSVLPGEGVVPLRETIEYFEGTGFKGHRAFKWEKIWNKDLTDAEVALPKFVEFMNGPRVHPPAG